MRTTILLLTIALALTAAPAFADDGDPTPAELARMILDGNEAEQALVAKWLEDAGRAELRAVFKALRALKAARKPAPGDSLRPRHVPPDFQPREPPKPDADGKYTLINAELRILDVDAKAAAAFLGERRPTARRNEVALTADEAAAILDAVKERKDVTLVTAPRITVYQGQKANVSVLNQVSYVKDYDVEVTKDGKTIADPVVDVVQEGTTIEFRPNLQAERKTITFDFSGTFAAIQRPIREIETEIAGAGRTVTIQVPEVRVTRIQTSATLPDGGWVLIGGGVTLEPKQGEAVERVTLVHLKSLRIKGKDLREAVGEDIRLK